ncbi:MAG: Stp1/IreP family PP2C-type Ser/Thr phosphatase [Clostridia bacterium]|nr:Stp1/IreP family PP2C-type Ser/Thr phosphatase [Clostridia bacterium]
MKYAYQTDKGMKRQSNQDACVAFCPDAHACFAIVCDGMGGSNAGDVASLMAVNTVYERVKAAWRTDMTAQSVQNLLLTSITAANICVYDASAANKELFGMGTTVVAAVVIEKTLVIAHAGDSRAYVFDGALHAVTRDHSVVQELVDSGMITAAQAGKHPEKNFITRALGVEEHIEIDFFDMQLQGTEKILLCSDGLTNFVSEAEICEILDKSDVQDAPQRLIDRANANGGGDNITAVIISE